MSISWHRRGRTYLLVESGRGPFDAPCQRRDFGGSPRAIRNNQRGVALVVALVLLVVATLIGLAGIRGTTLQERMSANMYDRSLAFHRAESALRAAEDAISDTWQIDELEGQDCQPASGNLCQSLPAANAVWVEVDDRHNVNTERTPGRPEYFIQLMETGTQESKNDQGNNADSAMYGSCCPLETVAFYRVTARSSAPADAGDRSIVVLQSTVKRAI